MTNQQKLYTQLRKDDIDESDAMIASDAVPE